MVHARGGCGAGSSQTDPIGRAVGGVGVVENPKVVQAVGGTGGAAKNHHAIAAGIVESAVSKTPGWNCAGGKDLHPIGRDLRGLPRSRNRNLGPDIVQSGSTRWLPAKHDHLVGDGIVNPAGVVARRWAVLRPS